MELKVWQGGFECVAWPCACSTKDSASDQDDVNGFYNWIDGQGRETAALFTAPALLRGLPAVFVQSTEGPGNDIQLLACRACLLTVVSGVGHNSTIQNASDKTEKMLESALALAENPIDFGQIVAFSCLEALHLPGSGPIKTCASAIHAAPFGDAMAYEGFEFASVRDMSTDQPLLVGQWINSVDQNNEARRVFEPSWRDLQALAKANPQWRWWTRWYQGFLDGEPLDWELQRRVALKISDKEWEKGPVRIAELIDDIETRWKIETSGTALADAIEAQSKAAQIGHNNPPENIDDAPITQADLELIARLARAAAREAQKPEPDRAVMAEAQEIAVRLRTPLEAWLLKKGDVAIDAAIKLAVTGSFTFVAYLLGYLRPFIDALGKWLASH